MAATKRRRLSDLYVVGKPAEFDDGENEPIEVWLQKPDPVQHEDGMRGASAARARVLIDARNRESDRWLAQKGELIDVADRDMLVDLAIRDEMAAEQARAEAEISAGEEWAKDDYLQGLTDSWTGVTGGRALKDVYAENPDDPEAKRVMDEMRRFDDLVTAQVEAEAERLRRDFEHTPEDELLDLAVEKVLDRQAMRAFADEYDAQMTYYSTRDPEDHKLLYFESIDEVRRLDTRVRLALMTHYRDLIVEVPEGKDLPGIPGSSPSSEQPVAEGTAVSSGPEAAPQ